MLWCPRLQPAPPPLIRHWSYKPVHLMYGSGSALCFLAMKISSYLFNEPYTISRYFLKTVSPCSPVRLMHEKKSNQSD